MRILINLIFVLFVSLAFSQEKFDKSASEAFQNNLNKEFAEAGKSPLTEEDRSHFKALEFFPINEKFAVLATFVKSKGEKSFEMKTTTTRTPMYIKYGELHFKLEGKDFKLDVFQNLDLMKKKGFKDYLFLPFSDLTSGNESYIGGRYIDLKIPKGNTILIDFNQAYNPYCAYNPKYSCPIVPLQNDLMVEIKAGVKKFHD